MAAVDKILRKLMEVHEIDGIDPEDDWKEVQSMINLPAALEAAGFEPFGEHAWTCKRNQWMNIVVNRRPTDWMVRTMFEGVGTLSEFKGTELAAARKLEELEFWPSGTFTHWDKFAARASGRSVHDVDESEVPGSIERIVDVASKWKPTGKIFTGYVHSNAMDNALSCGVASGDGVNSFEDLNNVSDEVAERVQNNFEHGFVTSFGRFITDRSEAAQIADRAKQLTSKLSFGDVDDKGNRTLDAMDIRQGDIDGLMDVQESGIQNIEFRPTVKAFDWNGLETVAGVNSEGEDFEALGAYLSNRLIASVIYQDTGDFIWLEHVFVLPEYRRRGLAEGLIREILKFHPGKQIEGSWRSPEMEQLAYKISESEEDDFDKDLIREIDGQDLMDSNGDLLKATLWHRIPVGARFQVRHGLVARKISDWEYENEGGGRASISLAINNPHYVYYPPKWDQATIKSFGRAGRPGVPKVGESAEDEDDADWKDTADLERPQRWKLIKVRDGLRVYENPETKLSFKLMWVTGNEGEQPDNRYTVRVYDRIGQLISGEDFETSENEDPTFRAEEIALKLFAKVYRNSIHRSQTWRMLVGEASEDDDMDVGSPIDIAPFLTKAGYVRAENGWIKKLGSSAVLITDPDESGARTVSFKNGSSGWPGWEKPMDDGEVVEFLKRLNGLTESEGEDDTLGKDLMPDEAISCPKCHTDLTQRGSVREVYGPDDEEDPEVRSISGHWRFDKKFVADEEINLDGFTVHVGQFCETCNHHLCYAKIFLEGDAEDDSWKEVAHVDAVRITNGSEYALVTPEDFQTLVNGGLIGDLTPKGYQIKTIADYIEVALDCKRLDWKRYELRFESEEDEINWKDVSVDFEDFENSEIRYYVQLGGWKVSKYHGSPYPVFKRYRPISSSSLELVQRISWSLECETWQLGVVEGGVFDGKLEELFEKADQLLNKVQESVPGEDEEGWKEVTPDYQTWPVDLEAGGWSFYQVHDQKYPVFKRYKGTPNNGYHLQRVKWSYDDDAWMLENETGSLLDPMDVTTGTLEDVIKRADELWNTVTESEEDDAELWKDVTDDDRAFQVGDHVVWKHKVWTIPEVNEKGGFYVIRSPYLDGAIFSPIYGRDLRSASPNEVQWYYEANRRGEPVEGEEHY